MKLISFSFLLLFSLYAAPVRCTENTSISPSTRSRKSSPASSSSKKWRKAVDSIGDDAELLPSPSVPSGNEPEVPYIKTVPIEYVKEERYPVDRLKANDEEYMKYIQSKNHPTVRSSLSQQIIRRLSRPTFMTDTNVTASLRNWLELKGTSIWDAVRIIESPNFDGSQVNYLNELPQFYLKKRMLKPFEAFLKRFQYESETNSLFHENSVEAHLSTPFTNLIFSFLKAPYLDDPSVDPFFKILVETQAKAFEACEWMFFDAWIRTGRSAWRYLNLYFDHSSSATKSKSLVLLLISVNYSGPITTELMEFIVAMKSFDPNVRVPFVDNGTKSPELTPFFHILVFDPKYSTAFLPPLLKCKTLDTSVPTGLVVLGFDDCEIKYVNESIICLAGAMNNSRALFLLISDKRISSSLRTRDFILFIVLHFIKVFWLTLCTLIRSYLRYLGSKCLKQ